MVAGYRACLSAPTGYSYRQKDEGSGAATAPYQLSRWQHASRDVRRTCFKRPA